jgi:Domain of unknown function (DUF4387)
VELWQVTKLIRSKNAGPFKLTFDIIFKDRESFDLVRGTPAMSAAAFAASYGVPEEQTEVFEHESVMAIKVSIPRPVSSGGVYDTDVFGGQFHSPLVRLTVPEPAAVP